MLGSSLTFLSSSLFNLGAADTNAFLNSWLMAQTNFRTWSAEFIQTRTLKALAQPLVATGHVWFAAPNQFHWELGTPPQTIALRSTNDMFVIYPRLKRAEHYPLAGNDTGRWRDVLALLEVGFPRERAELEDRFRILSLSETSAGWQLSLQPKTAAARKMITEIHVQLAAGTFSLASTELVFADGSRMRNDFANARLNPETDVGQFQWKPDADFKVTEPLSK